MTQQARIIILKIRERERERKREKERVKLQKKMFSSVDIVLPLSFNSHFRLSRKKQPSSSLGGRGEAFSKRRTIRLCSDANVKSLQLPRNDKLLSLTKHATQIRRTSQ